MTGFATAFSRELRVATVGLSPENIKALLVKTAKEELKKAIDSGEGSDNYTRVVNGVIGATEESVILPSPIVYRFNWMTSVAAYGLTFLRMRWKARGTEKDGHYRDSFFILGDGKQIKLEDVVKYNEIIITNDQPYARKVHVGSKGFLLPKGLFEDCRQAIFKTFGKVYSVQIAFIELSNGYILKGKSKRKLAKMNRKSSVFRRGGKYLAVRKDTASGQAMRYPALIIKVKDE